MKEYLVNYRGYIYLWAEDEKEIEKIFQRRFRRSGLGGEIEHVNIGLYFDPEEKERKWKEDGQTNS